MRLELAIAVAALAGTSFLAWRLRGRLEALRVQAGQAERLAASYGRSLALAAQELRGIAAAMEAPSQRILRLADDLAAVAAGPAVRSIHEAPAQLGPIVDAAVGIVSVQIRPGLRHWQVDPALRTLTVIADRRALEGALAALLRRAASHSRNGDAIALRWVVASETVSIVVEDEGDGLAAPDLVPEATSAPGATRGLDLGLSLARSLAAAHGGDIRLESTPGIGARAWLTLPRDRLLEAA
jgi:signal transduction histidine kinase